MELLVVLLVWVGLKVVVEGVVEFRVVEGGRVVVGAEAVLKTEGRTNDRPEH